MMTAYRNIFSLIYAWLKSIPLRHPDHSVRLQLQSERGAEMVEAAIILPVFLVLMFTGFVMFTNSHKVNTARFVAQDTLRLISVGPANLNGASYRTFIHDRVIQEMSNLSGFHYETFPFRAVLRNEDGSRCTNLNDGSACAAGGTFDIVPNSFVVLEFEMPIFNSPGFIAKAEGLRQTIRTGTQMQDFPN